MEEKTYSYRGQNIFCPCLGWFKLWGLKHRGAVCLFVCLFVCFALGMQLKTISHLREIKQKKQI